MKALEDANVKLFCRDILGAERLCGGLFRVPGFALRRAEITGLVVERNDVKHHVRFSGTREQKASKLVIDELMKSDNGACHLQCPLAVDDGTGVLSCFMRFPGSLEEGDMEGEEDLNLSRKQKEGAQIGRIVLVRGELDTFGSSIQLNVTSIRALARRHCNQALCPMCFIPFR